MHFIGSGQGISSAQKLVDGIIAKNEAIQYDTYFVQKRGRGGWRMKETVKTIGEALQLTWQMKQEQTITGIAIDSRTVRPGDLFVAIKGETTDGHKYLQMAMEKGAAAVAISDKNVLEQQQIDNYILVEDGQIFIQKLAHFLRKKTTIPVIAITGSMGKTSTKDFLEQLLQAKGEVVATKGNQNNELGMPLTICRLTDQTKALIVEMGMRGLGQIRELCEIAEPDYGIITCIGTVHCELLGSQENIAKAKCELMPYLPKTGKLVLQETDRIWETPWIDTCKAEIVWCGTGADSRYWATDARQLDEEIQYVLHEKTDDGEVTCRIALPVMGLHNVSNSMSAIALARELGVSWESIQEKMADFHLSGMRLKMEENSKGVTIINDAYNANPESMKSGIAVLMSRKANRKVAVLGNMGELGKFEVSGHEDVGRFVAEVQPNYLIAVGTLGKLIGEQAAAGGVTVDYAPDNITAVNLLRGYLQSGDAVLVKGSRSMQMEEIVQHLLEEYGGTAQNYQQEITL